MIMNGQVKDCETEKRDLLKLITPAKNIKGKFMKEQEQEPILPTINTTLLPCPFDNNL